MAFERIRLRDAYAAYLATMRAPAIRKLREARGQRYTAVSAMRGRIYAARLDESGYALRIGRGFFVSDLPGTSVSVGNHVTLYDDVRFNLDRPGAAITIGDGTYLNRNVQLFCTERISIGTSCAIGCDVVILDGGAHGVAAQPVTLGDHVWLGNGVRVMAGVTIGNGAAVGAGAVVTRDVPAGQLAVGVPARVKGPTDLTAAP